MTLAINSDEMKRIEQRLLTLVKSVEQSIPDFPSGSVYGSGCLARAAEEFESHVQSRAKSLGERWSLLAQRVDGTRLSMIVVEDRVAASLVKLKGII